MPSWLRWLLVVPAAWVGWSGAVLVGFWLHELAQWSCPRAHVVSGMCTTPWFRYVDRAIFCIGAGLAAALVVVACTFVAPRHRGLVAVVTFVAGSVAAIAMGLIAGAFFELATALVVGAL